MTKYLTTAAWAALVLGGVAAADTPPSESAEVAVEETSTSDLEAPKEITSVRIGDETDVEAKTETDETVASVSVEGEASAGGEGVEAEDTSIDETESE